MAIILPSSLLSLFYSLNETTELHGRLEDANYVIEGIEGHDPIGLLVLGEDHDRSKLPVSLLYKKQECGFIINAFVNHSPSRLIILSSPSIHASHFATKKEPWNPLSKLSVQSQSNYLDYMARVTLVQESDSLRDSYAKLASDMIQLKERIKEKEQTLIGEMGMDAFQERKKVIFIVI